MVPTYMTTPVCSTAVNAVGFTLNDCEYKIDQYTDGFVGYQYKTELGEWVPVKRDVNSASVFYGILFRSN